MEVQRLGGPLSVKSSCSATEHAQLQFQSQQTGGGMLLPQRALQAVVTCALAGMTSMETLPARDARMQSMV